MRVSALGAAGLAMAALNQTSEKVAAMQAQLSSQRKITKPSDDPVGTGQALSLRSQQARQAAYDKSTSDATARLSGLDSALGGMVTLVQRAQDLVRQGLNAGTMSADSANAIATQLGGVGADMLRTANAVDAAGRPLFGGTTTGSAAFDPTGTYLGNATAATRVVAAGVSIPVTRDGSTVFGSGSGSLFQVVQDAAGAVAKGDVAGARAALDKLGSALSTVSNAQSVVGADANRLQTIATDAAMQQTTTAARLSDLQDVDIADMAIKLSEANLSYNAALQATAKTSQTSLLDYLR